MYKLEIAIRYLLRRKIAYISIVAITFGVAAMIIVISIMDGFQDRIKESIRSVDASITIHARRSTVAFGPHHFDTVRKALEPFTTEEGGEIVAMSPRITIPGLLSTKAVGRYSPTTTSRTTDIEVVGIDPELESKVLPWKRLLESVKDEGRRVTDPDAITDVFADDFDAGILLGTWLAKKLQVGRGDLVTLTTAAGADRLLEQQDATDAKATQARFRVMGCFESGRFDYDSKLALCHIDDLRKLISADPKNPLDCQSIHVKIRDPERAEATKKKINDLYGTEFTVLTWRDRMKTLAKALDTEKGVMLIIMFCIVLVAGASICGILYMVVMEKTRDIGILMAMGATGSGITGVFFLYGLMLGVAGTALGTFLGLQAVWNLDQITEFLDDKLGIQVFPPDIYQFTSIPTKVNPQEITVLVVATLAASLAAAVLPALRASRLDPVRCLSYE